MSEIPPRKCPNCNAALEHATGIAHKDEPKAGDVGVCLSCTVVLVFNEDLTTRTITAAEYNKLHWAIKQVVRQTVKSIQAKG